ncbi:MAG: polyhydroxybutyrate depolymerase [Rhodoferax sp.]|nr:polyhydroxybutyrate depolymerase [Rhodoferax sp.]
MLALFVLPLLTALGAAALRYLYARAPRRPALSAEVVATTLPVGGRERRYLRYTPAGLPPNAPLLLVLHGAGQDADAIRKATAYGFERLADLHGFAVAYPEGFRKHWNVSRRDAHSASRKLNIDDKAFLAAVIDQMAARQDIDARRVFVFGFSNGGHMAFRMAQEMPERIQAIAVAAASLPTPDNSIATPRGLPVPALIVNGTADPINPYVGGLVTLFGFGNRGEVLSSRGTAESFARLNRAQWTGAVDLQVDQPGDATRVVRDTWSGGGVPRVQLYSVHGGGHVVPHPQGRMPRLLGPNSSALDTPAVVCGFFGL